MRNRMQLEIVALRINIVQHEDRAGTAGKEVLERQYLAAVAQCILCQKPQFGQAVEDDP